MIGTFLEIHGGEHPLRFPFTTDQVTLGRGPKNDIVLADDKASRSHAKIERVSGNYYVRDLGSTNGTLLNGQKLTAVMELSDGDVIQIGRHRITLVTDQPAPVEDLDVLTADDLVESDLDELDQIEAGPSDDILPAELFAGGDNAEVQLTQLAANLPRRDFEAGQIELTDSKGQSVHGAGEGRKTHADPGGAVELLRLLLLVCYRSRATDIHIEPREEYHTIRLRIDGMMVDIANVPSAIGIKIATVVKVLCEIDIGQRKTIQEGSFAARLPDDKHPGRSRRVDYRVSYAPAVLGQKLVVRILDSSGAPARLSDLGLPRKMTEQVAKVIHQESGMVLVVGPTGSGKTTTLYSLLRSIDLAKRNVVTIEDPVEVHLDGITQIPVDEEHDRSFLQLLRSVLRQDPDVILVGEIRDAETARVAMQAAITGHMVFSTLHTRDTLGTIFRLRDLGVEPYMLGQSLQLVIAQRLVRQLCPFCKQAVAPTQRQLDAMGPSNASIKQIYKPVGCPRCLRTGHAGRRAFFELLVNNEALSQVILANGSREDLLKVINSNQEFKSLRQSAYQLVADGFVGFDEVEQDMGT
jgi:type II secretory ATPase GspE/PulE/Tfp pilus assembly ATPase PilB-like protein